MTAKIFPLIRLTYSTTPGIMSQRIIKNREFGPYSEIQKPPVRDYKFYPDPMVTSTTYV